MIQPPPSSEAPAHLFSCPLEAGIEVAQNLPLPCVPVGGEVLRAGGGHVNQVVPWLLQQQAGEQGLGTNRDRREVKWPRQKDGFLPKSSPVSPQAESLLGRALSMAP